jgi:hypothetical protein
MRQVVPYLRRGQTCRDEYLQHEQRTHEDVPSGLLVGHLELPINIKAIGLVGLAQDSAIAGEGVDPKSSSLAKIMSDQYVYLGETRDKLECT